MSSCGFQSAEYGRWSQRGTAAALVCFLPSELFVAVAPTLAFRELLRSPQAGAFAGRGEKTR